MNPQFDETFDEVVTHVTWMIIDSITRGAGLRATVYQALDYAIRWSIEQKKKGRDCA